MKNFKVKLGVALLLAAGWTFTACNAVTDNPLDEPQDSTPVVYESDELVLNISKKGQLIGEDTWEENHQIGLFLTQGELGMPYLNDSLQYTNIKATMKAGAWTTEPEKVKLTEEKAVVFAYSPFRYGVDPLAIFVDAEQQIPYLYGRHIETQEFVNSGHNFAAIEMCNAMAMLELNFKKVPGYEGEILIDRLAFVPARQNVDIPVTGTMDIRNGNITPLSYGIYEVPDMKMTLSKDYSADSRVRLLVLPRMNDNGEIKMLIRVNGTEITMNLSEAQDWVKGTRSIYNVSCGIHKGTFEDFSIEEWENVQLEGELTKHD